MLAVALVFGSLALGASPAAPPGSESPGILEISSEAGFQTTSPPVRGLGVRLARKIREDGTDKVQNFVARGLSRQAIEDTGGVVTAELGPILAGAISGAAIVRLAPLSELIEAPQPLHP